MSNIGVVGYGIVFFYVFDYSLDVKDYVVVKVLYVLFFGDVWGYVKVDENVFYVGLFVWLEIL